MDTAKTGAYLASLRKNAGMTQQDAADRLGVSNKTISKWESGVSTTAPIRRRVLLIAVSVFFILYKMYSPEVGF